jgi:hypothetical protein
MNATPSYDEGPAENRPGYGAAKMPRSTLATRHGRHEVIDKQFAPPRTPIALPGRRSVGHRDGQLDSQALLDKVRQALHWRRERRYVPP